MNNADLKGQYWLKRKPLSKTHRWQKPIKKQTLIMTQREQKATSKGNSHKGKQLLHLSMFDGVVVCTLDLDTRTQISVEPFFQFLLFDDADLK